MANDEHVAILKKGVRAWNEWRDENPNVVTWRSEGDPPNVPYYPGPVLDLTKAHLARANLAGANLFMTNLSGSRATTLFL
jgi:Pentapeptide repeats (8 copies)